jgi:predicted acylesterase/phospholipase RssA
VKPPAPAFTFADVLQEERRLLRELARDGAPRADRDQPPDQDDEFLGLAFSGGGIRSATFNLGVLQALSELKLLKEFDYLSTVSGGGYIGSWLSAWIHRAGVDTVQQKLSIKEHPEEEPREVTFLRSYSNYLTPRTGLFSTDTLAAVATYLRNLILNLSIVLLCLTVVLLLPRLFAWAGQLLDHWPNVLLTCGALGLAVAVFFINLNLASQLPYSKSNRDKRSLGAKWEAPWYVRRTAVIVWIVLPLTLGAMALSFWLAGPAPSLSQVLLTPDVSTLRRVALVVGVMTAAIGFIWFCALKIAGVWRESGDRPTWRWRLGALVIGVLMGLAALVALQQMIPARIATAPPFPVEPLRLWWATVWGLPGLLGVFGLAVVFVIGVSGRQFEEDSREWWSRLGGVLFGVAVGWLVVAGLAIYSPPWVMRLTRLAQGLSIAWLVTTIAGVRAAMSASSGKPGSVGWRDRLALITPYVFLSGLLVALAFGIHAGLAAWHDQSTFTQRGGDYFGDIAGWLTPKGLLAPFLFSAVLAAFFSWRIDVNVFAFHMFYRNRLVRCYLGASNPRRANHPFTGFDGDDSVPMKDLRQRPYHLVNAALNITRGTRLAWQERKAASFVASPLFCGYELAEDDRAAAGSYQRTDEYLGEENDARLARRTNARKRRGGTGTDDPDPGALKLGLGTALAVSGAAASPNQGSHSSPAVAFLMTVFNVRLGWWLQNPAQLRQWRHMGPRWGILYLLSELLGMADDSSKYVYLSDGGHFENLGIYELVRRRCRFIVACDAGMDSGFEFEDLGNAIRKCQVDLGVTIDIDTRPIRPDLSTQLGLAHCAVGTIRYGRAGRPEDQKHAPDGYLLYIKPSITGSEPGDVLQYRAAHAEFPHESTSDQWFGESQFESYRKLGHHIARLVFRGAGIATPRGAAASGHPGRERMFVALKERWYPASAAVRAAFSRHADRLNTLQVALRRDDSLRFLDAQIYPEWDELMRGRTAPQPPSLSLPASAAEARAGFYFCVNLLQLMQSVYLDLNLEEEHDHPDNRGWMNLFKHWSWATMLRATYAICCSTFGARFHTFCGRRLDLAPGEPRVVSAP